MTDQQLASALALHLIRLQVYCDVLMSYVIAGGLCTAEGFRARVVQYVTENGADLAQRLRDDLHDALKAVQEPGGFDRHLQYMRAQQAKWAWPKSGSEDTAEGNPTE